VSEHPEFANRMKTKTIDYDTITGWFAEDFTLKELKTLRAKERIPDIRQHNTLWNGRYRILTFQEFLDLRTKLERQLHRSRLPTSRSCTGSCRTCRWSSCWTRR
jgi:glycerophosphoryl diester phosphodiesterase